MTLKKTALWTAFWIFLALLFNVGIYFVMGRDKALEFFAGYLIEKSLSMDNLFIFLVIFSYFRIDPGYQRRVLNYGISAAFVMRLLIILTGVTIVHEFKWVLYIFGAALIYSAFKIIFGAEKKIDPANSKVLKLSRRLLPVTEQYHEDKFFTQIKGRLHATPMFIVLILVESMDIVFAMDSIPAIFAVTTDIFIIYSSNVLAILGLRSLYFFLERVQDAFIYVRHGVGLILLFAGIKLLLLMFNMKVPVTIALSVILIILTVSIIASLLAKRRKAVFESNP